jgi:DNA-binding Xre family transcriptional regulator
VRRFVQREFRGESDATARRFSSLHPFRAAAAPARALGLTQNDAANLLGMSRVSYHRIETGVRRIRFLEIAAICEAFNCHVGELVQDGQLASAYVHAAKAILGEASP